MTADGARILVAGGTGTLGRPLVEALRARGHDVFVLSRRPDHHGLDRPRVRTGDLREPASLLGACDGIDVVVSAAGASLALKVSPRLADYHEVDYLGNLNLLREAEQAGVRRFVYVSVFHTPALHDLAYVRAHRDFEAELQRSPLDHVILRPTGYFAAFAVFVRLARLGTAPLLGTGEARTNPIHEADLAAVCAEALDRTGEVIEVGGPETLSRRALFERAFEAVGKPPQFVQVPDAVVRFNRRCLAPFDARLADLLAFFQAVSHHDIVAPPAGTRRIGAYFHALTDSAD